MDGEREARDRTAGRRRERADASAHLERVADEVGAGEAKVQAHEPASGERLVDELREQVLLEGAVHQALGNPATCWA